MKNKLQLFAKGISMGIAEVIPGVSGGTLAFITGIYEHLLESISAIFKMETIYQLRSRAFKNLWERIDGPFLLSLMLGMLTGVAIGVASVVSLLTKYPPVIWSFFFGLILGSVVYIGRRIKNWNIYKALGLLCGAGFAWYITGLPIQEAHSSMWYVFLSGAIAISALVLPGISGSFMLLIMGMYLYIIDENLKGFFQNPGVGKLVVIIVFTAGALTGLISVVRLLHYLLKKHHDLVLSILTGFMLGSLHKIWPWKNVVAWLNKDTHEIITGPIKQDVAYKIIQTQNVWPDAYTMSSPMLTTSIAALLIGVATVLGIEYFAGKH